MLQIAYYVISSLQCFDAVGWVGCWRGYLSEARCRLAISKATHCNFDMYTSTDFDISEKINYHLLAYFLSHISAENYKIRLMQAEFIAS